MTEKELLDRYVIIAEMMATMFSPFVETVVVDHRPKKPTIYAIFNNYITGRTVGFPTSDFGKLRHTQDIPDTLFNYSNIGPKQQKIKSSAIAIRNEENKLIGVFAAHCELQPFIDISDTLGKFMQTEDTKTKLQSKENFFFVESEDEIKKLITILNEKLSEKPPLKPKEHREKLMELLIEANVFKQKKAITTVASELKLSRQWVYTFLKNKIQNM